MSGLEQTLTAVIVVLTLWLWLLTNFGYIPLSQELTRLEKRQDVIEAINKKWPTLVAEAFADYLREYAAFPNSPLSAPAKPDRGETQ